MASTSLVASEALANTMAEALDRAIIQRYFGTRTPTATASAPVSAPTTNTVTTLANGQTRQMSTAAFKPSGGPPQPEAVKFLSMFGKKNTSKALDPMIMAAFSSAGDR